MDLRLKLCHQVSISLCCLHQSLSICQLLSQVPHADKMAAIAPASQFFIFKSSVKDIVGFSKRTNLNFWELNLIGSDQSAQLQTNHYYQRNTMLWLSRLVHITSLKVEMESATPKNDTKWKPEVKEIGAVAEGEWMLSGYKRSIDARYLDDTTTTTTIILIIIIIIIFFS